MLQRSVLVTPRAASALTWLCNKDKKSTMVLWLLRVHFVFGIQRCSVVTRNSCLFPVLVVREQFA